jgi:hypothetical protein
MFTFPVPRATCGALLIALACTACEHTPLAPDGGTTSTALAATLTPGASQRAEAPRPRGVVTVSPTRGKPGTLVTVNISGFPKNTDVDIFLSGKKVTTITTDNDGKGPGSFIAPSGPKMVPLEVKAQGGSPVTFGYATFTIIRE